MIKRALIMTGCVLLLAACTQAHKQDMKTNMNRDNERMQNAVQLELQEMNRSFQEWIKPQPRPEPKPIAESSYCYRSYGDVVCYKDPMPKGGERLVGYQEPPVGESPDVNAPLPASTANNVIGVAPIAPPYSQAKPVAEEETKNSEAEKEKPLNPYEPRTLIRSPL